eukprot:3307826-Pleurochrysis_carterae.AAC.2
MEVCHVGGDLVVKVARCPRDQGLAHFHRHRVEDANALRLRALALLRRQRAAGEVVAASSRGDAYAETIA